MLADDARAVFDLRIGEKGDNASDSLKIALSIEGLRTTTRVMHVLAWLLNQRAYLAGELSETQLARHNELPEERECRSRQSGSARARHPGSDPRKRRPARARSAAGSRDAAG